VAKFAINQEGANSLKNLANGMLININEIIEYGQRLKREVSSVEESLGIYGDEINQIIASNTHTLAKNRDDIVQLATRISAKADDVLALVAMGLGDTSSSVTSSSGVSAVSGDGSTSGGGQTLGRINPAVASNSYNSVCHSLDRNRVEHKAISRWGNDRTTEEIVGRLGGGDRTAGSCSSLAFAYAGNTAGYDVLDFRDGKSRKFFSSNASIAMIAGLPGVDSKVINGRDDVDCADRLLTEMKPGKEYYLATGQHASIVRFNNGHYEYLELQSAHNNGWHLLHDQVLYDRFGCGMNKFDYPNFLIDVESLANSSEFLDILGYINTAENNQMKGESGHVR